MNTEAYREKIKSIDHAIEWHAEELKAWQRVKAEAETTQAETPKLRSGHYGYFKDSLSGAEQDKFVVYGFDGSDALVSINGCRRRMGEEYFRQHIVVILGNIFDHLNAVAEPLKEFDYGDITGRISVDETRPSSVCIGGFWHTIKTAKILSMYIQRLIFTAEQESAK